MSSLQAHPNGCQEADLQSRETYIPCNNAATVIVGWKGRSDAPIRMCDFCAEHNVRNRGGKIKGTFVADPAQGTPHHILVTDVKGSAQLDIVEQVAVVKSAEQLIAEVIALKDKLALASKQYDDWCKPFKETITANEGKLLAMLNEQCLESIRADAGTAYKSTITSYKIADRDKVLDLIMDNWEAFGSEMLQFSVQKDAVKNYQQEHEGKLPEGLTSDSFVRLNIRRS